jgi:hypothetical protein
MLPPGIYQYKFIVDDEWRYATDLPAMYDDQQNVNNVLEVQVRFPGSHFLEIGSWQLKRLDSIVFLVCNLWTAGLCHSFFLTAGLCREYTEEGRSYKYVS